MKWIPVVALVLVVVGALNWGLWAVAEFDLVAEIFGGNTAVLSRIVYGLVALAGIYALTLMPRLVRAH
jgi:uncharacterized protein